MFLEGTDRVFRLILPLWVQSIHATGSYPPSSESPDGGMEIKITIIQWTIPDDWSDMSSESG